MSLNPNKTRKALYINPQNIFTTKGEDVFYCAMTGIPVVIGGTHCYADLFHHLLNMGVVSGDADNFILNVPILLREDVDTLRHIPKDVNLDYFWKPRIDKAAVEAAAAALMASAAPAASGQAAVAAAAAPPGTGPQFPGFPGAGIKMSWEDWETTEARKLLSKDEYLDSEYADELEFKPTLSWEDEENK